LSIGDGAFSFQGYFSKFGLPKFFSSANSLKSIYVYPIQSVSDASTMKKWGLRLIKFIIVAVAVSCLELGISHCIHSTDRPAGFFVGMADGALMPMAMPALFAGKDMPIYAANNVGRLYKLGYTVGVNACGAIFFGVLFWRVARWLKSHQRDTTQSKDSNS